MKMGSKRDDEKAVEELLCEAMDMVILEQAAAIYNRSDSSLPCHLETRFQLLKTFHPSTTQTPASIPAQSCNNLPHSSRGAKNGEQTMKKLRRYEKLLLREIPKNISPPKSRRVRFWCCGNKAWRRESKEERGRNSEQVLREMFEKARKEEHKICGEAEKVIKWVHYASAQMEPYIPH